MPHSEGIVSINPADGSVVWQGPAAGNKDIATSVSLARRVFPEWAARPLNDRIHALRQFSKVLEVRKEGLAGLIAREVGKTLPEARAEVASMIGKIEISIRSHAERCAELPAGKAYTRFKPHGAVAVLGPYNFPGHLPNGHICPALLAGNAVVFKPSELAPAVAEATLACWKEAGLPKGVLQVLQGGAETARALVRNPELDGVFFTGSAATGKLLARQFADTPGKILALEMGGNNPLIVDTGNIGNLDAAAEITIQSAFITTGQRCTCARRLLVIEAPKVHGFIDRLIGRAKALRIDDPFADPPPFMGPLASPDFVEKILSAQETLLQLGATPLLPAEGMRQGTGFISPGILEVSGLSNPPDEEIFGPLLQVIRVPDLDSAIDRANDTRYGLAAGLLSDERSRYDHAWPRLRAGIINWNTPLTGASSAAPFGGIKDSGNLRPSAWFAADYCAYPVASIEEPKV
ncbi:MAG: succinylglutamate-semialdehyde dehydrogenase [Oceanipulchritudo sp.]